MREGNRGDLNPEVRTSAPVSEQSEPTRKSSHRRQIRANLRGVNQAIRDGDNDRVEASVVKLSQSSWLLAALALVVGAMAMLFDGLRLLISNWRLTLMQLLPAMWIWGAMLDLKVHLFRGQSLHVFRGPLLVPVVAGVAVVTPASFFLNAAFAFAIARPGRPEIRPGFAQARAHRATVLAWGFVVGLALGVSIAVVPRFGLWWFALSLGTVIAVLMVCYVAVPGRLIGVTASHSRRDQLAATAVGGAIGVVVCSPAYIIGRIGLLMLGSRSLFILGIFVLALGVTLQAGTTSAVKTIKLSSRLIAGGEGSIDRTEAAPANGPAGPNRSPEEEEAPSESDVHRVVDIRTGVSTQREELLQLYLGLELEIQAHIAKVGHEAAAIEDLGTWARCRDEPGCCPGRSRPCSELPRSCFPSAWHYSRGRWNMVDHQHLAWTR